MIKYSCVIIGAGPAGLEAGLFLGRASVSTLIIGLPDKSDLAYGRVIGNLFGAVDEPPGKILLQNGVAQNKKYGVEVLIEEVVDLEQLENKKFNITTETKKEFEAETVIVATGAAYVKAGIQGEDNFLGKGVHTCVACDGIFFKGKKVAVVGDGSHAAQEAIELTTFTKDITIYTQSTTPIWSKELGQLLKKKGVKISDRRITGLKGEKMVAAAVFQDKKEEPLDGLFIALGSASSITFANKLGLIQKDGFLEISRDGKTNIENVWAAGGCTGGNAQIAKSIGDGCNASISVIKKIKGLAQYTDQT